MKILIIGYVWPEPYSSAAGVRDEQLIQTFQKAGWEAAFASPSKINDAYDLLKQRGIPAFPIAANDSSFDSWIKNLNPNFVIFDRFVTEEMFGWRVREQCPDAIRVIDTQDLHFLRRARHQALQKGASLSQIARNEIELLSEDCLREISAIHRSDLSLILSDAEMDLITQRLQVPAELLCHAPFAYEPAPEKTSLYDERKNFAFIGNFRHAPNEDGLIWLNKEIWPALRKKLPDAEVHVYGAYPSRQMMALDSPATGFRVLGPVEDSKATLAKYRVNLAPLRFGAGIKGKIADGWWSGTPAVSTPIGAEGMRSRVTPQKWGGLIAESASEFSTQLQALYQEPSIWNQAQKTGHEIMSELFSFEKNSADLISRLMDCNRALPELRQRNITGQMLWHHSLRSTEYFSRWIEAKESIQKATLA